jgi:hypothetical protein
MFYNRKLRVLLWLGVGVAAGVMLAGFWPNTPLHAVSTDRCDTFAMATGYLDDEIEAVYFLDFLTGDLRAAALSRQLGKFNAFFGYNVNVDLGVDPAKNPRFLMVTGAGDLRKIGGARMAPSKSILYVAEITTGKVAAYYVPWSMAAHSANQPQKGTLMLLDVARFRTAAAPVGGPATKGK